MGQTSFENNLETLFLDNPLFTPYVGSKYNNGILIIGESHYVRFDLDELKGNKGINEKNFVSKWGTPAQQEFDSIEAFSSYYNTRMVLAKYFGKRKNGDFQRNSYVYFRNLEKVLDAVLNNEDTDISSWEYCSFMNYYQVPSLRASKSVYKCFDINGYESLVKRLNSLEVVKKVIDILNPKVVIVTEKKAAFELKKALPNVSIIRSVHPSCPWWNRPYGLSKKSGKEQLVQNLVLDIKANKE